MPFSLGVNSAHPVELFAVVFEGKDARAADVFRLHVEFPVGLGSDAHEGAPHLEDAIVAGARDFEGLAQHHQTPELAFRVLQEQPELGGTEVAVVARQSDVVDADVVAQGTSQAKWRRRVDFDHVHRRQVRLVVLEDLLEEQKRRLQELLVEQVDGDALVAHRLWSLHL